MSYTKTASLPVSPDEAFALVTDPERLRRWQTVSATVDLRAGGAYRWTVTPGHVASGTFREVEPGRRLVFGWGWDGSDDLPPDASTVTVTLEPTEGGSLVTLVHDGLDEQQAAGHAEGWNHYVERLERLVVTGDAGQDEWAWAPADLSPTTAAEAVLAALQPMLRSLNAEDQPKQTPCADFSCHDVAVHLFGSLTQLGAMAGATVLNPEEGSLENRLSVMVAAAIDAWRGVDLDGTVPGPGGAEVPATFAVTLLPVELLLHGWDIAQGAGRPLHICDEVVGYVHRLAEPGMPRGRELGAFGDEVTPPADAGALERLAALAGRTPVNAATASA